MKRWGDKNGWYLDWKKDIPEKVKSKYFKLKEKIFYTKTSSYRR